MITPTEIQNKVFPKTVRGYKEEAVDSFLDLITEEMACLIHDNEELMDRIAELEAELERKKQTEVDFVETLNSAKNLMSDISESAEKRGKLIIENAEQEATLIINRAQSEAEKYKSEITTTKKEIFEIINKYKEMLESEIVRFDNLAIELHSD